MDFKDELLQLSERIAKQKDRVMTEEATKIAFVLPFIQILGYDIFNSLEVEPEHTCDVGTKKGEKIDYAIKSNGEPILLVECKHWSQNLALHSNQLFRYYVTSKARFAILTNGIQYKFFSDVEKPNVMDAFPFFEMDIVNINEYQIEQLRKFHKSNFDEEYICETIPSIKYINDIFINLTAEKTRLEKECANLYVCYTQKLKAASAEAARMMHQLEYNQRELDARSQKIRELEDALRTYKEVCIKNADNSSITYKAKDNELDTLIDYLNMPVPYNWRKLSLFERKAYWTNVRTAWTGEPREFICNAEVAREFYEYERKDVTVAVGRKVADAIRRTNLFYQDGVKRNFGEYGSALAWIRIKKVPKNVVKTTIKNRKK